MLAIFGRPETWNWLLMFHVLTAFVLVGASLVVTSASLMAARSADQNLVTMLRGVAFRTNLVLVLLGGSLAEKEYPDESRHLAGSMPERASALSQASSRGYC
jgi:hypothetical protein